MKKHEWAVLAGCVAAVVVVSATDHLFATPTAKGGGISTPASELWTLKDIDGDGEEEAIPPGWDAAHRRVAKTHLHFREHEWDCTTDLECEMEEWNLERRLKRAPIAIRCTDEGDCLPVSKD
jgi:hypothetical protein